VRRSLTDGDQSGGIRTFPSACVGGYEFSLALNLEAAAAECSGGTKRERERGGGSEAREREYALPCLL
jgi:hypothetical protein